MVLFHPVNHFNLNRETVNSLKCVVTFCSNHPKDEPLTYFNIIQYNTTPPQTMAKNSQQKQIFSQHCKPQRSSIVCRDIVLYCTVMFVGSSLQSYTHECEEYAGFYFNKTVVDFDIQKQYVQKYTITRSSFLKLCGES